MHACRVPFPRKMNTLKLGSPRTASSASKTLQSLAESCEHPTSPADGILAAIGKYEAFCAAVGSREGWDAVAATITPLTTAVALAKKTVRCDNFF